jgi:hypothetical protein
MTKQPARDEHLEIRTLRGLDKPRVARLLDRKRLLWGGVGALIFLLAIVAL